jgi:hypothetical protein
MPISLSPTAQQQRYDLEFPPTHQRDPQLDSVANMRDIGIQLDAFRKADGILLLPSSAQREAFGKGRGKLI